MSAVYKRAELNNKWFELKSVDLDTAELIKKIKNTKSME